MKRSAAEHDVARLARTAEYLVRLAKEIGERRSQESLAAPPGLRLVGTPSREIGDRDMSAAAREALEAYWAMPDFGVPELFRSPAWVLMLKLFMEDEEQGGVPVKVACLALGGAQTTAHRYLLELERRELIVSVADPLDGRRRLLRLSSMARDVLTRFLAAPIPARPSQAAISLKIRSRTVRIDPSADRSDNEIDRAC